MKETILLVDDEIGILKVLGISLSDRGYRVLTAQNGEEALRIFGEEKPAVVLTDIKMPGMDGIQLLQEIKSAAPDVEVIMITGHGDMELAIRSLQYEASDFITKPISDEALGIALKRAGEKIISREKLKEYTENLEKLVEEKSRKLIESERMAAMGETVAGLAHAIKNITSGLTGGLFVLQKGIELENKGYLSNGWDMVSGNVEKIKLMAMDLLNYCKDREPEYRTCDPNQPAEEVFDLMQARARDQGVDLRAELSDSIPETDLDPEWIHRALLNLVTNAVDACTDFDCKAGTREVVIRSSKPEGWAVEYQVEDNGCGMNREIRDKVFQTFFSTKGSKGTGLGLMITKKIIDEHGGVIDLTSEKGQGSTFRVRLPERKGL